VRSMRITATRDETGVMVLAVAGELALDTADGLAAAIANALAVPAFTCLVVDLAQVTFLDMAALSILLRGHAAALRSGLSLRIARPRPLVRRVLQLTETYGLLAGRPVAEFSVT
jgi:anti-anti-sigma factor